MNKVLVWMLAGAGALAAQVVPQITCDATADPLQIRSEGLAERVGQIVLICAGPAGGGTVSGTLNLFLSHPVTNRLSNGGTIDAAMVAETAAGVQNVGGSPLLVGRNGVIFGTFTFALPASGRTSFTISNVRVAPDGANERSVTATLSSSGSTAIGIRNNPVTVGVPRRGLFTNGSSARIVCTGSTLPEEITFSALVGGNVRYATTRVTEGYPAAFDVRSPGAPNGTRIVIRYAGLPSQARLFVPDYIAGSSAIVPTSAGDLGWGASGGQYALSTSGSLLLGRVIGADPLGAGSASFPPFGSFNSVSEVPLLNGSGTAAFEVLDANPSAFESAQIPTFVALPRDSGQDGAVATAQVSFGPVSALADASASAPVPRFRDLAPQNDCSLLRDCNANYFPRLVVDAPDFEFTVRANTPGFYQKFLRILNDNAETSLMNWNATISYRNGSGWLKIFPESGTNSASANLSALPEKLTPGYYEATLTIDAGPLAGTRAFTVRLTVLAPPPPPAAEPPVVRTISNFASPAITTVVPGSLATLRGIRLIGRTISVTFDGIAGTVLGSAAEGDQQRVDLVVPVELGLRSAAQLQVITDGVPSAVQTVTVSAAAPAIFPGAVLNQDGRANAEANPETTGNFLQVYATGLPAVGLGTITAKIHDREISAPAYGGPAPTLTGVQQVNFRIPEDLPTMTTEVLVCGIPANASLTRVCSRPVNVSIRRVE